MADATIGIPSVSRNQPKNINPEQDNRRINNEDKLVNYIRTMLGEPLITVEVTDEQIKMVIDDTIRHFSDFAYGGEQTVIFELDARSDIQDYRLDERVQAVKSVSFGGALGSIPTSSSGNYVYPFGTLGVNYIPHITLQGEVSSLAAGGSFSSTSGGTAGGVAGGPNSGNSGLSAMVDAFVTRSQVDTMNAINARAVNFEFNSNTKILRIFENFTGKFLVEAAVEYVPNPEYDEVYSHPWVKEYALNKVKYLWGTITGKYSQSLVGGAEINYADMKSEAQTEIERLEEDLLNKYSEALGIFSG
jgi:hypothetical protein